MTNRSDPFALARLLGTPERSIVVQTRAGTNVANAQAAPPSEQAISRYRSLRARHFAWQQRKAPAGTYNCFGLVWASRRTAIYEDAQVDRILREDGFRRLQPEEEIACGDVAIYSRAGYGLLHAGLVLELRQAQPLAAVPWILSKWDDASGEDLHAARDVPAHYDPYVLEYWTDR